MEKRLVKIGEAARMLGTSPGTLRKWEVSGEITPARNSKGGTRYSAVEDLAGLNTSELPTLAYARVSSHDQKADLDRQQALLEAYCTAKGWRSEVIRDPGSGMNSNKKGLKTLLEAILRKTTKRLVLTHKDRLLRFGAELVFTLCERQGVEVVIIHKGDQPTFEEEPAQDVLEIMTVFSARRYGSRSKKHKNMMKALEDAAGTQD